VTSAAAALLSVPEAPEAPVDLADYVVVSRIAEGGMGIVLRARDRRDGRLVALKTARSSRPADGAAIRREIAVLRGVDHPGIVRLREDGVWNGIPWMAMELLEGRTLCRLIRSFWPGVRPTSSTHESDEPGADDLPTVPVATRAIRARRPDLAALAPAPPAGGHLAEVFAIMRQLCMAVGHLHDRGIVHRDVKPANVMIGDDGRVTLFDFGLACAARDRKLDRERGSICIGTLEYAAPEQICGGAVDARADIYSLGCMLYELCTGQRPFDSQSSQEVVRMQLHVEPRRPSELVPDLPWPIEELLGQMLSKRPEARSATCTEDAERLARIAGRLQLGVPLDAIERVDIGSTRAVHGRASGQGRASGRSA